MKKTLRELTVEDLCSNYSVSPLEKLVRNGTYLVAYVSNQCFEGPGIIWVLSGKYVTGIRIFDDERQATEAFVTVNSGSELVENLTEAVNDFYRLVLVAWSTFKPEDVHACSSQLDGLKDFIPGAVENKPSD